MDVTLAVDALDPPLSGIGRYTWQLCTNLPRQAGVDRVRFIREGRFIARPASLLEGSLPPPRRRFERWLDVFAVERRLRNSVVHGPNFFLPPKAETGIITVHDLSVFRFPELHPEDRLRAFDRDFGNSLRRARHVITDSETVRREVVEDLGIPEHEITAIPLGVGPEYRPRDHREMRALLAHYGLTPGDYALCVSTLEPRKKISELLSAWRDLPTALRRSTPLVLAGPDGWLNERLHEQIRRGIDGGWLKHLGFVPEATLPALYAGASLFLYPSTYEGFGLPPLEAMASGVPTVVAAKSCLPETCGDAAAYVDPDDIDGFRAAIVAALTDNDWRRRARQAGRQRAALFRWDKCVAETADVYRRCAS